MADSLDELRDRLRELADGREQPLMPDKRVLEALRGTQSLAWRRRTIGRP
jgi:hypothetical protein